MIVVGVDIGGTKIDAAVVEWPGGTVLGRARADTPRRGADAILAATLELIARLRAEHPTVTAIGVGAPGLIDPASGIVIAASAIVPGWLGAAVADRIREATGLPVTVDNDVRAMARAEATFGAAQGLGRVLFLSVGTGVGGAIGQNGQNGQNGRIAGGRHGSAGEIAHLVTSMNGALPCGCGATDHLEALLSGPALEAAYAEETGYAGRLPEIAARIARDGGATGTLLRRQIEEAGRTIGGFVSACDIDAVVVAGGVAQAGDLLFDPLTRGIRLNVWPRDRAVPMVVAELARDAAVLGAALLVVSPPDATLTDG
jgi:glucokinase